MKIRFFAGIFFISAVTLCLEITLTRFFSISQQYHFAFLVVSIAFLGYGSAGSFLTLFRKTFRSDVDKFLASSSLLFSISILSSYFICNAIPFDFIKLSWDSSQVILILLYYVVLSVPFFFAGIILSFAISRAANRITTLYFFDLFGAGTGAVLAIFIFLPKGDRGVFLALSFFALIAVWLFGHKKIKGFKFLIPLLMAVDIVLFVSGPSWLSFHISEFKAMPVSMRYPGAKHLFTKWNAISRVDVIDSPAVRYAPGLSLMYTRNLPDQIGLLIDGSELNAITRMGKPDDSSFDFLSYLPASLPYFFLDRNRVLLLEPKGGLDVLAALFHGAAEIKVIENNPLIENILDQELADFSGEIYRDKNIRASSSNSRAALMREEGTFDLIVFSLADVLGSAGTGQFGIGENYLYTEESFLDALNRLSETGIASMTLYLLPPPRQEVRILATWIEALRKITDDPGQHLIVLRSWGTISIFVKKSPYRGHDIDILKEFCDRCLFDVVYYPGIRRDETNIHNRFEEPIYHDITRQILSVTDHKKFYRDYLFQVKPVSDDRPFFANFFKLNKIKTTFDSMGQKWLPFVQGEFLVPLLFIQAGAVAFVLILLPVLIHRKKAHFKGPNVGKIFMYFSLIGMSFMLIEITMIQKFILFLGHPLYSTAIIIFALLFSSGAGSLLSNKILGKNARKNIQIFLSITAALILCFNLTLPFIFRRFAGMELVPKILFSFSLILPLGFLMGFPFPTGIRALEKTETKIIPWAWAANAFSSVVSSVAALMIAFLGGYHLVLAVASAGYFVAPLFLGFTRHGNEGDS